MPSLREAGIQAEPPEALMAANLPAQTVRQATVVPEPGVAALAVASPVVAEPVTQPQPVVSEPAMPLAPPVVANVSTPQPYADCSDQPAADVIFNWVPLAGAMEQWLDVSFKDDGFRTETRMTTGALGGDVSSYTWPDLPADQSPVFWRINTKTEDGWQPAPVRYYSPCAPTGLRSSASCGDQPSIEFSWTTSPLPVQLQWLEVSAFDNGFAAGTFTSVGPIAAGQTSLSWQDLPGNALVWRVHSLTTKGWRSSEARAVDSCDSPVLMKPRYTCVGNDLAVVEFRWAPSSQDAQQWLDLSYQLNGFEAGTFISGEVAPDAESHLWPGIQANVPHFYRVHALTADGWRGSITRSFTAYCPNS